MSTQRFTLTEGQQKELRACPHVRKVGARTVQYTADFKRHAVAERARGKPPRLIWSEAGIPYHFRPDHAADQISDWRRIAEKYGSAHFDTEARGHTGTANLLRHLDTQRAYKAMTDTEKIAYLEARQEALEHIARHFGLPPSIHKAHSVRRGQK
jgi:transposase-like protein